MSRPASRLAATSAQAVVELRLTGRRGENLLAIAVIPVAVLVFFSTTTVLTLPGGSGVAALLPGCLALAIVATGLVNLGIATAYERSYGVLKRLGGSPLGRDGLVAAKILAVGVIVAVQVLALVGVAAGALGWRPPADWSPALLVLAAGLGTVTFVALGLLMAGTLRAEAVLAVANGLFVAALLIGGVLVPASDLPGALGVVAGFLPSAALADLLRVALGATDIDAVRALVILVVWGAVAVAVAVRTFRWD